MAWEENGRHFLPIGRGESHETIGGLCRRSGLPPVVDGTAIAIMTAMSADTITEGKHHDDL
jgi:hypothetical protein